MMDMNTSNNTRWMKVKDISKHIPLSDKTIRKLIREGKIKSFKPDYGPILVRPEDVDEYIESCIVQCPSEIDKLVSEVMNGC